MAGKTGTAQKYIDGKYSNDHFISNFVGFFPTNKPEILSVIVLDEPKSPMHWGGKGAAVAFKRVMERIINMDERISPPAVERKQEKINHFSSSEMERVIVPQKNTLRIEHKKNSRTSQSSKCFRQEPKKSNGNTFKCWIRSKS